MPGPPLGPLRARFAELVLKAPSGHWLWQGPVERRGYGTLGLAGRRYYAHRLSLLLAGVEVAPRARVAHTCGNLACVRPEHLAVVLPEEPTPPPPPPPAVPEPEVACSCCRGAGTITLSSPWADRALRVALGLAVRDVADRIGVTSATLSNYEHGRPWALGPERVTALRKLLVAEARRHQQAAAA